jgi:hypothetical protein
MSWFVIGLSRVLALVASSIRQNPVLFNGTTGFSLFAGSDALAQQIETRNEELHRSSHDDNDDETDGKKNMDKQVPNFFLDHRRVLSAGIMGIFFGGVVYPFAYARLDALWAGVHFSSVLKRSLLEIATVGIFVNSVSMCARGISSKGHDKLEEVSDHVVREMPVVTLNDARVWLPYNLVAFSVIPIHVRPATTSLMEAVWQTYISLRSHDYHQSMEVAADQSSSDVTEDATC